jgi:hypothetical protein
LCWRDVRWCGLPLTCALRERQEIVTALNGIFDMILIPLLAEVGRSRAVWCSGLITADACR